MTGDQVMTGDSQRARMLAGQLYDVSDPELVAMRLRARRLTRVYNHSGPDDVAGRRAWLAELLGALGDGVIIEPPFHCDYGVHIRIGEGVYVNFGCVVLDCNTVEIGAGTQIAPHVVISAATHPIDPDERRKGPEMAYPVTIGRNIWIGAGAVIGAGVTIGDDTTIGAGSIVLDDVPPRVLAAGTPCRVVRPL
jgi:maltose O-acetyltransferase